MPEIQTLDGPGDGFIIMHHVGQWQPAWWTGDKPTIHRTERDAQLEFIDTLEDQIAQFKDGEREFEEIDFEPTDRIEPVTVLADGTLSFEWGTLSPEQLRAMRQ